MDIERKKQDPSLVCTCSELYVEDITEAIEAGEEDYIEIMQYNDTFPRCGECDEHISNLVNKHNNH
jgi:bacterioferritin-associated ferredoxin